MRRRRGRRRGRRVGCSHPPPVVAQSAKRPEPSRLESSGPIERSLCDEHVEELHGCQSYRGVVPAPPGVVMVAPPEVPRNAQQGKVQAALQGDGVAARPIVRPGAKPMWRGLFPGLRHQVLLYVTSKVSASIIAAYTHDI